MAAVGVDQAVAGDVPQPEMKRHRRVFVAAIEVLGQPAVGFDQHVLHNVAGVHAALDHAVHPQVDHPPQRLAVAVE